ncbi:hypothetical protein ACHZKO_000921 [Shigella sonnei]|uniref:hypothetical protein n=1 Tax=Escherichia coli TaxID=562 RepID=UPI000DE21C52|nr:hypothetical protein [Escherichia coli]EIS4047377.1 hypothetical protein [Salmonella enterica]HDS2567783.1 hypothetical protein [Klebsiella pneumoniae subsp. pneumoniae]MEB7014884.1 hypothetical protein [Escherichia coli]MEB7028709.1 hypothetical protein [Escherichia coli]MEB7037323.1 hypothetical protein [Escherichia coli]
MERSLKILEALGVNLSDFEKLDQTQLLMLYRVFEAVEEFGMYKSKDTKLELDGKAMQEEVRRVLLSRNGGVIK